MTFKIISVFVSLIPLALSCNVYIFPKDVNNPLSPGFKVKPFTLNGSELTLRGKNGTELSTSLLKELRDVEITEFDNLNQVFIAWKRILLMGDRNKIDASALSGSLGFFSDTGNSEHICDYYEGHAVDCKPHVWPLWNSNKDNIIYQAVRKIVSTGKNPEFTEALNQGESCEFKYVQCEGSNPHWGVGMTNGDTSKRNTYGHILNAVKLNQKDGAYRVFYVGPKTASENSKTKEVAEELGNI